MRWLSIPFLLMGLLSGCGAPPPEDRIPPQKWGDIVIQIETRPLEVHPGMNEFLVIATEERGRPYHNLVVSLRGGDKGEYHQAIQDGLSGVYRRAINIPGGVDTLDVKLREKRSEEETNMVFKLKVAH